MTAVWFDFAHHERMRASSPRTDEGDLTTNGEGELTTNG
jgi:hypothetical protein